MQPLEINNKYKIVDTLYKSELQNIYLAEDTENFNLHQMIVNELMDASIIYAAKDVFNDYMKLLMKNFIDYFYADTHFYIVSKITTGTTLDNYLATNSLRISEKMAVTESLLMQMINLEEASPLIKYHLLNVENITVGGNRSIGFNLDLKFDKDNLNAAPQKITGRLGDIICCIFANTPKATLESDRHNLPPAIASIVKKCKDGEYNTIQSVYKDFKASLLYSTFVDNSSVDKQILKGIQKAKRKRSGKLAKRFTAAAVVIALLAAGVWYRDTLLMYLPAFENNPQVFNRENQIPIAKFSLSKNKIYAGDQIDFICQASDPDLFDRIVSYEWSVSKNDDMFILFSREKHPSYIFETEGNYVVSLVVRDTIGISSSAYKVGFQVLPKSEIPTTSGAKDNSIRK